MTEEFSVNEWNETIAIKADICSCGGFHKPEVDGTGHRVCGKCWQSLEK